MKLKRLLSLGFATVLTVGVLTSCGSSSSGGTTSAANSATSSASGESVTIKVGASITPHSEILEQAKPILAKEGVDLEIVEIEDTVTPNTGLVEGSLDANFFQHQPYLDDFNSENKTDLVSIGSVHYEPFGIYAGKTTDLAELPDGAVVAVPNNVTNEARALLLLEQEGILTLKEDVGIKATVNDIVENPKNITFKEIDPAQLVRALPDVDVAVINGNYAIEGGLSVKDALAVESDQGVAAKTYANIVVVRKEDENNEALQKLVEVLQSDEIQQYINDTYDGSVVPIAE
ncbi:MAG: MetQ/NlpA family ABC transporter substrate-binding protein [Candidatus Onthomonas sp.]|nr:MetQ/NlpA family ABC transporter substrate-binding protein [Candidatus Onthomonas sp.]